MNKVALTAVLCIVLAGCQVKKREVPSQSNQNQVTSSVSREVFAPGSGIFSSDQARFLVHPSLSNFVSNESNTTHYTFWIAEMKGETPRLEPHPGKLRVEVEYAMPEMPSMIIDPAAVTVGTGKADVTYNISMPGWWRVKLTVFQDGKKLDTFSREYDVPES
jgi:hypothetical protein